eukprot:GSA25T00005766001.1
MLIILLINCSWGGIGKRNGCKLISWYSSMSIMNVLRCILRKEALVQHRLWLVSPPQTQLLGIHAKLEEIDIE